MLQVTPTLGFIHIQGFAITNFLYRRRSPLKKGSTEYVLPLP
jgi:hypothetical protein